MDPRIHRRAEPEKGPGDLVVEWLNEASLSQTEDVKVTNLCKVQEILVNKEPQLLPLYLDEALQFSLDRNAEVKKTVTGFIEEAG